MPTASFTKSYSDGNVLTEQQLDDFRESAEDFLNITQIDDDNIQNTGITGSTKLVDSSIPAAKLANNAVVEAKIDDLAVSTAKIQNDAVTEAKLADDAVTIDKMSTSAFPPGIIWAYGGTSAPTGWLLCDGTAVDRTTYADLFAVIGETAGEGDGSTTFNVPDFRGRFLRGRDGAAGRDPDDASRTAMNTGGNTGDAVFSVQGDQFANHNHGVTDPGHTHTQTLRGATAASVGSGVQTGVLNDTTTTTTVSATTGISINGNGGNETRPINAYVNYIIKI